MFQRLNSFIEEGSRTTMLRRLKRLEDFRIYFENGNQTLLFVLVKSPFKLESDSSLIISLKKAIKFKSNSVKFSLKKIIQKCNLRYNY